MTKVNNEKLGWRYWPRSGVSIVGSKKVNARWGGLFLIFVSRVKWLSYSMSYNWIKIFGKLDAFRFQTFGVFFDYYCLWGHPFMTSTKNDQQMTLLLQPSAKMNNRSNFWNNGIRKHVTVFKKPPLHPRFV